MTQNYIVILDAEQNPVSMLEAETFVLFLLRQKEGNVSTEVHQTDTKNLLHLEMCARAIAGALQQCDRIQYQLMGKLIQRVIERTQDVNETISLK
jgi:hypothetical protein